MAATLRELADAGVRDMASALSSLLKHATPGPVSAHDLRATANEVTVRTSRSGPRLVAFVPKVKVADVDSSVPREVCNETELAYLDDPPKN